MKNFLVHLFILSMALGHVSALPNWESKDLKVNTSKFDYIDTTKYLEKLELANIYLVEKPDSSTNLCLDVIFKTSAQITKSKPEQKQVLLQIQIKAYATLMSAYRRLGKIQMAMRLYKESYHSLTECNDVIAKANYFSNYANVLFELGDIEKAIHFYSNARDIYLKLNDKSGIASSHYNIAKMLFQQNKFEKSLESSRQALDIIKQTDQIQHSAYIINLIASNYIQISELKEKQKTKDSLLQLADKCLLLSLNIKIQYKDLSGQVNTLNNLCDVSLLRNDIKKALEYVEKAEPIAHESNNPSLIVLTNIHFAQVYQKLQQYDQMKAHAQLSFDIAERAQLFESKKVAAELLSQYYRSQKDHVNALKYYEIYVQLNDSLKNNTHTNQLLSVVQTYESKTKTIEDSVRFANQIYSYKTQMIEKELDIKQRKTIRNWLLTTIILLIVISIYVYKGYMNQKKLKSELNIKNRKIERQYRNLENQKQDLQDINDSLKRVYNDKIQSIKFAKKIQLTTFPNEDTIKRALPNSFIIYKPLDIVSGDFYWVRQIDNIVIVAVGDSTGHGVPGAFLSIMGIAILKEIINNMTQFNAAEILNEVRLRMIESLQQSSNLNIDEHYGIDLGIVIYDKKDLKIQFSGAFIPLYIIRNPNNLDDNSSMITFVKGDKMPISLYPKMDSYTNHLFKLKKGDSFYMFTDGATDQYGGNECKKLGSKAFIDFLLETSLLPLDQQKIELELFLTDWKRHLVSKEPQCTEYHVQTDDVTILGVRA